MKWVYFKISGMLVENVHKLVVSGCMLSLNISYVEVGMTNKDC